MAPRQHFTKPYIAGFERWLRAHGYTASSPSEVANLRIGDIDWARGRIAVCATKSRRAEWLPLTQEVGDAIVAYLECQPRHRSRHIFLTEFAPIGPLTRVTSKCLVARALTRAGVNCAHRGAHVLRHSAATGMLRNGVSLTGVGAALGHRSPDMTTRPTLYIRARRGKPHP